MGVRMLNSMYYTWANGENINYQPDITIAVGNMQHTVKFLAHKCVLSGYSGYFKTLFSSFDGTETHVSNIGSHTFAYLLSFMYTGHLELNPINVYEIFLASNLLHITEALTLCKQYLNQKHNNYARSSVIKPIPRRNTALLNEPEAHRTLQYQPLRLHDEQPSSIFKPVRLDKQQKTKSNEFTNEDEERSELRKTTQPELANEDDATANTVSNSHTVIFDIACCDGPIKFHRVTNQYYNPDKAITASKKESTTTTDESAISCRGCTHILKHDFRLQKYFSENQFSKAKKKLIRERSSSTIPNTDTKYKKKTEHLQCYQCKTCGSKFPSYYFVHKHRKLHHQVTNELTH